MAFAIHQHESAIGVHVSFHLQPSPPFHSPPHPIPLGCPRAPALGALLHASNLHWSSALHMVIYMFQCYSLKSFFPCLLPQSPKVCSLYLCLFYCLGYRVIVIVFLNSIYMHSYTVLVFPYICSHILYWCFHIYAVIYCIGVSLSDLLHSV